MKISARSLHVFAALLPFCLGVFAQERFDSPDAAAKALIAATADHDNARLNNIFGPEAHRILTSGDSEQDRAEQKEFSRLAANKYQIEPDQRDTSRAILSIGDEDWPFPVPLVLKAGKWSFDPAEALVEMEARKIGTSELDAIEICQGYVEAQKKYSSERHDGDTLLQYASRVMSAPGRHNGLYWDGSAGALVPKAFAQAASGATRKPYHGYYFRILDAQGPYAPGGAHNYLAGNKLIGGFGLVAWPARYGVTGIHTFIVNQDGVVYEKDIPPTPGSTGTPVRAYNPDDSWTRVQ